MSNQTDVQAQAGKLLAQFSGYVGTKTIHIGLKLGLFETMARHPEGVSPRGLAEEAGVDEFYAYVWLRAAYAAEVLDCDRPLPREDYDPVARRFTDPGQPKFTLAPHMESLLLDQDHPAYVGGMPSVLEQPEFFDLFSKNMTTGDHIWWNDCSPEMIRSVSCTGRPFYTRMIPGGFSKVPGLDETLNKGAQVTELACGAGHGLRLMAETYPEARFLGIDGDALSLELAREKLQEAGVTERIELRQSTLEDMDLNDQDMVFINISLHECRDIDRVLRAVYDGLRPGGLFVISDFPFPERLDDMRSVPARILCGIQYFESLIDDQLMPTAGFLEFLGRHGFRDVGSFDLTPVHAVSYGRK